jgi:hypothetical protein
MKKLILVTSILWVVVFLVGIYATLFMDGGYGALDNSPFLALVCFTVLKYLLGALALMVVGYLIYLVFKNKDIKHKKLILLIMILCVTFFLVGLCATSFIKVGYGYYFGLICLNVAECLFSVLAIVGIGHLIYLVVNKNRNR